MVLAGLYVVEETSLGCSTFPIFRQNVVLRAKFWEKIVLPIRLLAATLKPLKRHENFPLFKQKSQVCMGYNFGSEKLILIVKK